MPGTGKSVGVFEAKTKLSELLERVCDGEEFTITKHEKPVARLVPVQRSTGSGIRGAFLRMESIRNRALGSSRGRGKLSYRQLIEEGRRR